MWKGHPCLQHTEVGDEMTHTVVIVYLNNKLSYSLLTTDSLQNLRQSLQTHWYCVSYSRFILQTRFRSEFVIRRLGQQEFLGTKIVLKQVRYE